MIDMSQWPTRKLHVLTEVRLDPQNVRLESTSEAIEADILADLVANEDVLGLVQGIVQVGFLTHEIPIVIEAPQPDPEGPAYIVVEGNRRLAALKLIQNPLLAGEKHAQVERALTHFEGRDTLTAVDFRIAPNRDIADQLIAAIHTTNPRRAWTPARQAAFFESQLDSGKAYSDLRILYPTANVERFVLFSRLRNRIASTAARHSELAPALAMDGWRRGWSTLSRIFESEAFGSLTEIRLSASGTIESCLTDAEFDAMSQVILEGIKEESLNTRTLNSVRSPRFQQLISEMRQRIAEVAGAPVADNGDAEPSEVASEGGEEDSRGPSESGPNGSSQASEDGPNQRPTGRKASAKRPRRAKNLPVETLEYDPNGPVSIRRPLEQLSALDVSRMPDIAAITLRAFLERAIKVYADANGENIAATVQKGGQHVQLGDALKWLEEYWKRKNKRALAQTVSGIRADKKVMRPDSLKALNASAHNPYYFVDPDDAWEIWDTLEPVLREVVQ